MTKCRHAGTNEKIALPYSMILGLYTVHEVIDSF